MNWKTYKTLTSQQQKEYDYRFKKSPSLNVRDIMTTTMLMMLVFTVMIVSATLVTTNDKLADIEDTVMDSISTIGTFIKMILMIVFITFISYLIKLIIYYYQYNRWLKKNKIKILRFYDKWRK